MKTITKLSLSVAALALSIAPVFAAGAVVWDQGFEADTSGWFDDSTNPGYGTITQVPSGTNGIASMEGSAHAIIEEEYPFSRFDGYRDVWPGTWIAEIGVYLDTNWDLGSGFDYSVAANGSDGNHQRDFIFHITKDTSTENLLVGASNNTNFNPREDLENINHYTVTETGWYTLRHTFRDDGGVLAVDMSLVDSNGNVLWTETRSDGSDTMDQIGGNRYAWFTAMSDGLDLAIDNHRLIIPSEYERSAEITSPTSGEEVWGVVNFEAVLDDYAGDDSVQWAVREGTCAAGIGTVFGNVDGHSDPYTWDGSDFHASADVSSWTLGDYCFVFNPTESVGDTPIRETLEFKVVEPIVGPPIDMNECKKDGWMTFNNPTFKNQGDCVSYVQSNEHAEQGNKKDN